LGRLAAELAVSPEGLRRLLNARWRDPRDLRRWAEEAAVRDQFRGRFHAACQAVDALAAQTVRAGSLVVELLGFQRFRRS
jgi:hypothetical protein